MQKRVKSSTYGEMTCVELDFKLLTSLDGRSDYGHAVCSKEVEEWRDCCCQSSSVSGLSDEQCGFAPPLPIAEPIPHVNYPEGPHPHCDLCKNGHFPGNPYMMTAIAYVPGNPTCMDLYWMGRTGNVPGSICWPLQNFMEKPCGCLPEDANMDVIEVWIDGVNYG
jgi:hypothetical protein